MWLGASQPGLRKISLGVAREIAIIIIIIIIIIISFIRDIYAYIPETNYVPRQYSIAAILLLLFMVLIPLVPALNLLYFYICTLRSMCAVPNMAVFWSSLTSCLPGMLLTYFRNDFETVPVAPIITGITFVFTFHMRCISIVRSLYFRIFSVIIIIIIIINFGRFCTRSAFHGSDCASGAYLKAPRLSFVSRQALLQK